MGAQGALKRGREAAERMAWVDAYAALSVADSFSPLAAQDLELLATSALLLGHVEDGLRALQRAHQLHAEIQRGLDAFALRILIRLSE